MNKIIKLIYINILGMFNINQIFIAREDGVKSNLETKTIITSLIFIFLGYLYYKLITTINLDNPYLIINVGFIISTLTCFIVNLTTIEPIIFKNTENDILFSMPISIKQILFSKLFSIYLKNLLITSLVMTTTILSFIKVTGPISDTFFLIYIFTSLVIPFIPIVISSLLIYCHDYLKANFSNNIIYKIIKYLLLIAICSIIIIYTINTNIKSIEQFITQISNIYLFTYIFSYSLQSENILAFIANIGISILLLYLFYEVISNNYIRICSILKGIKKSPEFHYKKTRNYGQVIGVFKKEITYLFQNKTYLINSYGSLLGFSFVAFFLLKKIDFTLFEDIKFFDIYFNTYLPTILATISTFSNPSISSVSLEKDNIKIISTMPISLNKLLLGKWLSNIFISSIFVLINGTIATILLNLENLEILFCYLLPFIAVCFTSLTSLLIDLFFIEKNEKSDNIIIKQRLINFIPMCLSILIGTLPLLTPLTEHYYQNLGSYIVGMIFFMIIEIIYYLIQKQNIIKKILQ